jgi:serine/threonine-protein kinase
MQPSIPTGTVLQNRYRILQILGQGGFGRTYLAEDQGRFNELCAIKEYIPPQTGLYGLEKSQELFKREASALYQIQHPQVPQFRAVFEENGRLFLSQDYVEGKTYSLLLEERRNQGYSFSVDEVSQLLHQMLPVLAHIHGKNIIHRDISPDNIIRRQEDGLPVLIDFGVVKELATRLQVVPGEPGTTVGKPGYAPSEQIQTGQAYPSSDLYSLAVTAVVLLTGQQPTELFDTVTTTWHWQRFAPMVTDAFARIVNRMLSFRPGDRFQSAEEALMALGGGSSLTQVPAYPEVTRSRPSSTLPSSTSEPRGMTYRFTPSPPPEEFGRSGFWDDPWMVAGMGLGVVMLAGVCSWAIVQSFLHREQTAVTVTPTPSELFESTTTPSSVFPATPVPGPSATVEPQVYRQRLDLPLGQPQGFQRKLTANESLIYIIPAQQGQRLNAYLTGEGVLMTVYGVDRKLLNDQAERVSLWEGELPDTGDYYLEIKTIEGVPESNYTLELNLDPIVQPSPPEPTPEPYLIPTPTPAPPTAIEQDITFAPGTERVTLTGQTGPVQIQRYRVQAKQGATLNVQVLAGSAVIRLYLPNGTEVPEAFNVSQSEMEIATAGIYVIELVSEVETAFGLAVRLTEPEPPEPTPTPVRPSSAPTPIPESVPSSSPAPQATTSRESAIPNTP